MLGTEHMLALLSYPGPPSLQNLRIMRREYKMKSGKEYSEDLRNGNDSRAKGS
jgi:hypothetical protein